MSWRAGWRALPRGERALVVLAALALLAGLTVRTAAALVSEEFAAYLTCPLPRADLPWGDMLDRGPGAVARGVLHDELLDARGRPWRFERDDLTSTRMFAFRVYSVGADGEDDHGHDDDVVMLQRPGFPVLAAAPWIGVGLALLALWAWAVLRALQAPRGHVALEAWRAAVVASPPVLVAAAVVDWNRRDLPDLDALQLLVSPPTAAAGTLGLLLWLGALWLRMRRPRADDPDAPLAWRRPAVVVLVAALVVGGMGAWAWQQRRVHERRSVLARACLGLASLSELVATNDDDLIRAFVRRDSPFVRLEGLPSLLLERLGRAAGAEANPLMARALGRDVWSPHEVGSYPAVPWRYLRAHDPTLDALVAAASAGPERYRGLILTKTTLFAARLGRCAVARALEPLLDDVRPTGMTINGREQRVCEHAAEALQRVGLVAGSPVFGADPDPALAGARAWFAAGAVAASAGWVVIDVRDAAVVGGRSKVEVTGPIMNHGSHSGAPEHLLVGGPYEVPQAGALIVTDAQTSRTVTIHVSVNPGETVWLRLDLPDGTHAVETLPVPP